MKTRVRASEFVTCLCLIFSTRPNEYSDIIKWRYSVLAAISITIHLPEPTIFRSPSPQPSYNNFANSRDARERPRFAHLAFSSGKFATLSASLLVRSMRPSIAAIFNGAWERNVRFPRRRRRARVSWRQIKHVDVSVVIYRNYPYCRLIIGYLSRSPVITLRHLNSKRLSWR